jgi:hypothetical protein
MLSNLTKFLFVFAICLLALGPRVHAYSEFIAYGYGACLTCHVNGSGNGPLNDYGRAVWSGELAARVFYPSSMSDDDIAEQSGFFGKKALPYWVRPHIKYRGMDLHTNPGSSVRDNERYLHMQADVGATFQDEKGKNLGLFTFGRMVTPSTYAQGSTIDRVVLREYYLRTEVVKSWWFYAGLIEKVYGIRNIDHSSYQRAYQGFGVTTNSPHGIAQSRGLVLQKIAHGWDAAVNLFAGNPYDDENYKASGLSATSEFEIGENRRFGCSVYSARSNVLQKQMAAIHYRHQVVIGSAILTELGVIQDQPAGAEATMGSYFLLNSFVLLQRGFNFTATVERYNKKFDPAVPEQWKWAAGFLVFPAPRFEIRAEAVNMRQFSSKGAVDDQWALEAQIHVSL